MSYLWIYILKGADVNQVQRHYEKKKYVETFYISICFWSGAKAH